MSRATVYIIPTVLHDEGYDAIPANVLPAAEACNIFFVEELKTARRYLKKLSRNFDIDAKEWHQINENPETISVFKKALAAGNTIGILSEAGCPGVADPGQALIALAQKQQAVIRPLTGPSSILLALMASGMNGQHFKFNGYLPIDEQEREKMIRQLENESAKTSCTQIFIETPYRNQPLFRSIVKVCQPTTRLCIGVDISSPGESIITMTVTEWKSGEPSLHKRPAIFLLQA